MKDKDFYKLLLKNGWELKSINGSHHKLTKNDKIIILPIHNKDLKKGLENKLRKETGL